MRTKILHECVSGQWYSECEPFYATVQAANSMGKCGKNSLGMRLQSMGGSKSQYQGVSVDGVC